MDPSSGIERAGELPGLFSWLPSGVAAVVAVVVLALLHRRFSGGGHRLNPRGQATLIVLTALALLAVVLLLPDPAIRGDTLAFLGVVLSAAVAFSSSTLIGNLMAGLMLRAVKSFEIGDFIRVEDCFGRVSERGLFHTEVQTEDRDLMTLPNLWLTTRPVQVVRPSGTVLGATVSIGYDEPHGRVRSLLMEAAEGAGLEEPFAQIVELGDHAVTYRAAGVLRDLTHIVSSRSKLRARMLDALHAAGVEIVSPEFHVVRTHDAAPVAPPLVVEPAAPEGEGHEDTIETVVFDKAEEAASIEGLKQRLGELSEERKAAQAALKTAGNEQERARLKQSLERADRLAARLEARIREGAEHPGE